MAGIIPRGVRKMSELTMQTGRAPIITEEDSSKLSWGDIPDGTLKINPKTGIMSVKVEGESDWIPAGIKNDGTICIAKDTKIVYEIFLITKVDLNNKTFEYVNEDGHYRNSIIIEDEKTKEIGYLFEVEKADYMPKRNMLEVAINDTLIRTATSGGLIEITNKRFSLGSELRVGDKINVRYGARITIGNPYPRIYMATTPPQGAQEGDLWLDENDAPYADAIVKVTEEIKK